MRLYKVVILLNIALGLGFLSGYLWWHREIARLSRELLVAKQTDTTKSSGDRVWLAKGIVRGVVPEKNLVLITHEEIPGLMGGMTMGFPARDPALLKGLAPGDPILFTLKEIDSQIMVVAVQKEAAQ